jgi:hypothetical protein
MRLWDDTRAQEGHTVTRRTPPQPSQPLAPTRSEQACASQQLRAAGGVTPQMRAGGINSPQAR